MAYDSPEKSTPAAAAADHLYNKVGLSQPAQRSDAGVGYNGLTSRRF